MLRNSLIIDAGFFVALFSRSDEYHDKALALRPQIKGRPWITTWPVLTETCHLLIGRCNPSVATKFIKNCQTTTDIFPLKSEYLPKISSFMDKYQTLPMDLADASLLILAEELGHGDIVSTDERDFNTYRWKSRKPFNNLLFS